MQDHDHYNRPVVSLIRRDRLPEHALPELSMHRTHYWVLALMVLMLAASLYLLLNTGQILERFQIKLSSVEDSDSVKIRQYNQKLEALQDRMTAFVADSVETQLKTLEKNVTDGKVGAQDIKALEELKGEVQLLEKYSAGKGGNITDTSRLDHARYQITPGSQNAPSSAELLYEVSHMKRLLYLGIASCGFVGFLLGGFWWQNNMRIKRLAKDFASPRLMIGRISEDR